MGTTTWAILGLVTGLIVGALLVWLITSRRRNEPTVVQLKAENARFREEVNAHFVRTAELINELTDSYKKVFDHLSDGAERLVDGDAVRNRMPQVGHHEVRLRHIGAPRVKEPEARPAEPLTRPPADYADGGDGASEDNVGARSASGADSETESVVASRPEPAGHGAIPASDEPVIADVEEKPEPDTDEAPRQPRPD